MKIQLNFLIKYCDVCPVPSCRCSPAFQHYNSFLSLLCSHILHFVLLMVFCVHFNQLLPFKNSQDRVSERLQIKSKAHCFSEWLKLCVDEQDTQSWWRTWVWKNGVKALRCRPKSLNSKHQKTFETLQDTKFTSNGNFGINYAANSSSVLNHYCWLLVRTVHFTVFLWK